MPHKALSFMDNFYLSVLVLRVSYLRCLIYKVHAPVSFSADVLFILALTLSLVKNFFQTFLRFFSLTAVLFVLFKQVPASRRELI